MTVSENAVCCTVIANKLEENYNNFKIKKKDDKTDYEVFNTLNEEQKKVVYKMVGESAAKSKEIKKKKRFYRRKPTKADKIRNAILEGGMTYQEMADEFKTAPNYIWKVKNDMRKKGEI